MAGYRYGTEVAVPEVTGLELDGQISLQPSLNELCDEDICLFEFDDGGTAFDPALRE